MAMKYCIWASGLRAFFGFTLVPVDEATPSSKVSGPIPPSSGGLDFGVFSRGVKESSTLITGDL